MSEKDQGKELFDELGQIRRKLVLAHALKGMFVAVGTTTNFAPQVGNFIENPVEQQLVIPFNICLEKSKAIFTDNQPIQNLHPLDLSAIKNQTKTPILSVDVAGNLAAQAVYQVENDINKLLELLSVTLGVPIDAGDQGGKPGKKGLLDRLKSLFG